MRCIAGRFGTWGFFLPILPPCIYGSIRPSPEFGGDKVTAYVRADICSLDFIKKTFREFIRFRITQLTVKCARVFPERILFPPVYLFGHTWASQLLQAIHRFLAVVHRVGESIAGYVIVLVLEMIAVRNWIAGFHMV